MFNVEIFSKTLKGRIEIAERSYGLSPKLRQALILVDGRTQYGILQASLQHLGEPEALMRELSRLGMVASDYDLPEMPEFPQMRLDDHPSVLEHQPTI